MPEQLGDPRRIFDIRFAPGHCLDVLGMHHEQFALPFQEVIDRSPVHASRNLANRYCLKQREKKSD
jgi:hypothetical protein